MRYNAVFVTSLIITETEALILKDYLDNGDIVGAIKALGMGRSISFQVAKDCIDSLRRRFYPNSKVTDSTADLPDIKSFFGRSLAGNSDSQSDS